MLKINKIALLLVIGVAFVAADTDEDVANKLDAVLIVDGLMDGKPCT